MTETNQDLKNLVVALGKARILPSDRSAETVEGIRAYLVDRYRDVRAPDLAHRVDEVMRLGTTGKWAEAVLKIQELERKRKTGLTESTGPARKR